MQIRYSAKLSCLLYNSVICTFSSKNLPKHEKFREAPNVKDFHKTPGIQRALNKMMKKHTITRRANQAIKLSEYVEMNPNSQQFKHIAMQESFEPNYQKINKELKKEFNKKITKSFQFTEQDKHDQNLLDINPTAAAENKMRALEYKEFKRLEFEKRETKRLIAKEDIKIENVIENDKFNSVNTNKHRHKQYKENINVLQNERITNFIGKVERGEHNKKLAILIQSGLMNKGENIMNIIEKSLELMQKNQEYGKDMKIIQHDDMIKKMTQNQDKIGIEHHHSNTASIIADEVNLNMTNNLAEQKSDIAQNEQPLPDGSTEANAVREQMEDIAKNDKGIPQENASSLEILPYDDKEHNASILIDNASSKKTPADVMTVERMINLEGFLQSDPLYPFIQNIEFNLTDPELKSINFSKLRQFFQEFMMSTPEEQNTLLATLKTTHDIREYEYQIFQSNLPAKGRLLFTDMTPAQQINYLKYNIITPEGVLEMWEGCKTSSSPQVAESFIEKLALYNMMGMKNNPKIMPNKFLHVIKDNRYKAIVKYVANNISELNNEEMVKFIWSLGKLHRDEGGIIHRKFWDWLNKQVIVKEVEKRVNVLKPNELSFMCEGLLNLSSTKLNKIMEEEFKSVKNKLIEHIDLAIEKMINEKSNTLSTLRGLSLYLSYINNHDCKEILYKMIPLVERALQEEIDEFKIYNVVDIVHSYGCLMIKHHDDIYYLDKKKEEEENRLTNVKSLLNIASPTIANFAFKLHNHYIADTLVVYNKFGIHSHEMVKSLKAQFVKNIKNYQLTHGIDMSILCCSFAQQDIADLYPISKTYGLKSWNSIFTLFPRKIFKSYKSPQYIPYTHFAKHLMKHYTTYDIKWMTMMIYGLASIKYYNISFYEPFFAYYSKNIQDLNKISILVEVIEIMSILRLKTELYYAIIRKIHSLLVVTKDYTDCNLFILSKLIVSIANLGDIEGLVSQTLMPTVLDKIRSAIQFFDINILISMLWGLIRLEMNDSDLINGLLEKVIAYGVGKLDYMQNYLFYQVLSYLRLSGFDVKVELDNPTLYEIFLTQDRKIMEVIEELETNAGILRMTFNQILEDIKGILVEYLKNSTISMKFSTRTEAGYIPLILVRKAKDNEEKKKSIALLLQSTEDFFPTSNENIGIFEMKIKLLERANYDVCVINSKLYSTLGSENDDIDTLRNKRLGFLREKLDI